MGGDRNVHIGHDVTGSVIITGDNNQNLVFPGVTELSDEIIEKLRSGALRPFEVEGAVPLPALTLAVAFVDKTRQAWTVVARRPGGEPAERTITTPWMTQPGFAGALDDFWRLSRRALENDDEEALLDRQAHVLGDGLAAALAAEEAQLLVDGARGDPPPPLLVVESDDDLILALPWELLRLDGRFAVHDGRLDMARCVPVAGAPNLEKPSAPITLLINVSAPEGSGLNYEAESYFITRALHDHVGVVVNEMGEVGDLVDGLRHPPHPLGVHFSGHGGPGTLLFEDSYGGEAPVKVDDLLTEIRRNSRERLPRFFYLACCHGGDAPSLHGGGEQVSGISATASELHRDGLTQVVGYFGPVYDRVSTWAETAFYREIAAGHLTRDAVRAARVEMIRPAAAGATATTRDAGGALVAGTMPYGWAQMVLYHRGPDYPLGLAVEARTGPVETGTTERLVETAYPGSRTEVLRKGFVGRRREMHALRRDLKEGRHLHVVQGVGGFGKSAFCTETLKLYARQGWQPVALWCADVEDDADPAGGLLRQFDGAGQALAGEVWDQVAAAVDRMAGENEALQHPPARLAALVAMTLEIIGQPLVLYLDNLESLLAGPDDDDPEALGHWRDDGAAALWGNLAALAEKNPGRLAVLASCRYRNADFRGSVVPFARLPNDALYRLIGWFTNLRRLGEASRARLVEQLAGHPRSVEFLDGLIKKAIADWEDDCGTFVAGALADDREWTEIVAPALPSLEARLSQDLLFDALWERVLDPPSRDLLVRATVLRLPADRALMAALHGEADGARTVINRLRDASLLTEVREYRPDGRAEPRFEVHPAVARLALARGDGAEALRREGHRRAGDFLEAVAPEATDLSVWLDAAHHLGQVGEVDRAFDLLHPLAQELQNRGRMWDSIQVLEELGDADALAPTRRYLFLGLVAESRIAFGDLPGALQATYAIQEILQELATQDPSNAGWQRDLSVSQEKIGDVLRAQGRLDEAGTAYRASLEIAEALAAADPSNAGWQRDLSVSHDRIGNVLSAQGRLDEAVAAYRASLAIREALAAADPSNAGWQRDLSVSHNKIGEVLSAQGRLDEAGTAYRASLEIFEALAAADPSNAGRQRDLSVSHDRIGNVLSAQGRLDEAGTAYRASLAIREALAAADPSNAGWQRDLSVSHDRIGDVLSAQGRLDEAVAAYRASLEIAETLAAADPSNAGWQRDLSVSQEKIGNVLSAQGRLDEAVAAYRASLEIRETLAAADPSNAGWQRDLSVSHNKIGEVLSAQGRLDEAGTAYRASLEIFEALAAADPSNAGRQRDLSVSHDRIGDVLRAQGRLDEAGTAYRASLEIAEALAAADPSNAGWQRDLSVSHDRIGNVLSAQGRLDEAVSAYRASLAIREALAAADPSNAGWQRDLSVSQEKIGDVLSAQGRLDEAGTAYRASLSIREALAAADPSNAGWQRDLSVSHDRIGNVLSAQGRLDEAVSAYRASLAIREALAAADPSNAGWQRDLSVSHERIGDVLSAQGRLDDAEAAYRASLAIREALAAADPSNAGWQTDVVVSCFNVAQAVGQASDGEGEARQLLQRALDILQRLDAEGLLHGPQRQWIDAIEAMLAENNED